ncbi:hypothetical protein K8U54_19260 [Pseudomonas fulva]|uniref:hypothetical protein n=1 Tax=Pseudomonas fulva TaxID=47880 RepID=UPI00201D77CD|nr:hypothetical protein [Pseudomonas fulva]UQY33830.1 hypothetical protein K8U54_19260 [Pseudomonas fulva]
MAQLKFFKVTALPGEGQWEPNALYFLERDVQGMLIAESIITNQAGEPRGMGNSDITSMLISAALQDFAQSSQALRMAADIAQRDAIARSDPQINKLILVADAIADESVERGAALYFYDVSEDTFTKVAEYESIDIEFTWSSIKGGPTSTPAQLDDAADKAHVHANKGVLDQLSENASQQLTFRGAAIGGGSMEWATVNW